MLVPLLLQALHKYALLPAFSKIVSGFIHSEDVIEELGDKEVITSLSLRSLCKTVLGDTGLSTASAVDRSRVLVNIVTSITGGQMTDKMTVETHLAHVWTPAPVCPAADLAIAGTCHLTRPSFVDIT